MKDYREMADAVFARRDEYVILQRRKKKIAINTCLSLCAICLAVVGAISIWKTGIVVPDPEVLGTKPGYIADNTEDTSKHTLSSNATSEGEYSEATPIIIGTDASGTTSEVEPTSGEAVQNTKSTDATKLTDPEETVTKPSAVSPTSPRPPVVVPTLPQAPVATDPAETNSATEKPPSYGPDIVPNSPQPETQAPATDSTYWVPEEPNDDPVGVTDGWAEPDTPEYAEPTVSCTESNDSTQSNEGPARPDEAPATEAAPGNDESSFSVSGKVFDQYGKPVRDCEIWAYSRGMVVATTFTDSSGSFNFRGLNSVDYFVQHSAPAGYTPASYRLAYGGADSATLYFYCTKN